MRSRRSRQEAAAEVARRRLELLGAELAGLRPDRPELPDPGRQDGPGEPSPAATGAGGSGSGVAGLGRAGEAEAGAVNADAGQARAVDAGPAEEPDPESPTAAGDSPPAAGAPAPPVSEPGRRPVARPGRHARRGVGRAGAVAGWLTDRLPAPVSGRVQLGASHLTVVAVIVAASLAATCWWVLRADGRTQPVPVAAGRARSTPSALVTPSSPLPAGAGGSAMPAPSAGPSTTIVVDVAGKVRHPGIATLPLGARVVDALEAAGGVRKGVRLGSLNLARVLTDGEQVLVGVPAAAGVAASAAGAPTSGASGVAGTMVNINTAGQSELETLPGVGPVTAQAILQWRSDNGAFTSVDELLEVSGIGDATLAKIAPYVTL